MKLGLYYHTVRHLSPVQVVGRLRYGIARPRPDPAPAPPLRGDRREWKTPPERNPVLVGPARFDLLGEVADVVSPSDWNASGREALWLYHLHYFDDLNAAGAAARFQWHAALIDRWIAENPPGQGTGWDAYPVSLRIVNWIKWMMRHPDAAEPGRLDSLAVQARWLAGRIEHHLRANHLFVNAKALLFAGAFFDGRQARDWFDRGLSILERELPEQILADGGQFERSPMYHALAYEDVLDIVNLSTAFPAVFDVKSAFVARCAGAAERMGHWLAAMCHPDGEIGFFNDAAIGTAPPPDALFDYARRLGIATPGVRPCVTALRDSGYVRLEREGVVALLDVAPVGPDYQPGHAHADTLSFELSIDGRRVVVNSGTSLYGVGPERQRQRGTAAHSTVTVDGADSSEVWSGFRVARRARPFDLSIDEDDAGTAMVRCRHDGYTRLPGRPVHARQWRMGQGCLSIVDEVSGRHDGAVARFHLHPEVSVYPESDARFRLEAPGVRPAVLTVADAGARVAAGTWHPRFGASIPNRCIEVTLHEGRCTTTISWA